jgi:activator of HSP90 ATPase
MATIQLKVKFPVKAKRLYELYLNSEEHSEAIGSRVKISGKIGASYSSWDQYISGKTLHLLPEKQIVQTWRASDWEKTDGDSILVLSFSDTASGSEIEMIHSGVPEKHAASIKKGWADYYWKPLKKWLHEKSIVKK